MGVYCGGGGGRGCPRRSDRKKYTAVYSSCFGARLLVKVGDPSRLDSLLGPTGPPPVGGGPPILFVFWKFWKCLIIFLTPIFGFSGIPPLGLIKKPVGTPSTCSRKKGGGGGSELFAHSPVLRVSRLPRSVARSPMASSGGVRPCHPVRDRNGNAAFLSGFFLVVVCSVS